MEIILPCHPKDLPKLADGTVLTLPLRIGIAVSVEKVKVWQTGDFLIFVMFLTSVIVGNLAFLLALRELFDEANTRAFVMGLIGFSILFTFAYIAIVLWNKKIKFYSLPNFLLTKKFTWQSKTFIEVLSNQLILNNLKTNATTQVNLDKIQVIKFRQYDKKRMTLGTGYSLIMRDDSHLQGLRHFKNENIINFPYITTYANFVLNETYQVTFKETAQILEKFRKTTDNQILYYHFDELFYA